MLNSGLRLGLRRDDVRRLLWIGAITCLVLVASTVLQPGGGYPPHRDKHEVAILVIEGTLVTLGERVGPNSVIFYGAHQAHGMKNVGSDRAKYIVFEFHGDGET